MPVNWVDNVAPVNAENLEIMEADIAAVKATADAAAPALTAHVAAADPHTGYQRETEKGAANGYASLDGTGVVPDAQIPAAIARDTEVTNAISAHAALADPHTGYVLDADLAAHVAAADPHTGYQRETERGAANGYAPLDGTSKVPIANLPAMSGGGVDYIGNWGAGTAYKKGDVVRHNGQDYMAVNDSTGVTPPAAAIPPIVPGVAYGTSLPASPFDGQEAIVVDSLTASTYALRYRYNAGAGRWESISLPRTWRVGGVSAAAVSVSTPVLVPDLTLTMTGLVGRPLLVMFRIGYTHSATAFFDVYPYLDGAAYVSAMGSDGCFGFQTLSSVSYAQSAVGMFIVPGLSGTHTLEIRAATSSAGGNYFAGRRHLHIQEI